MAGEGNGVRTAEGDSPLAEPVPRWGGVFLKGLVFYCLTSLIVVLAAAFAVDFVPLCTRHSGSARRVDLLSGLAAWDGEWYVRIASRGYSYDPDRMSSVAFFPLYPSLGGALVHTAGMRPEIALLVVSHGALIGVFFLLAAYVHQRFPGADAGLAEFAVLAMALFPTTFFFRMAYTESTFLLLMLWALYGMERGWGLIPIASIIGLTTAARTVGVALVPVFGLYLWQRLGGEEAPHLPGQKDGPARPDRPPVPAREPGGILSRWLAHFALLLPLCCWGLLAYMLFQWTAFGEPTAFLKTQTHWNERPLSLREELIGAMTLEPLRAVYDPSSACYWGRVPPEQNALFNLKAANPVYFLGAVVLVGLGAYKRWVNGRELLLSVGLLSIAYFLQGPRTCMSSQARYAAVVFPMYIVLGHLLYRLPPALATAILAISGLFLAIYSAMFVSWYWFY